MYSSLKRLVCCSKIHWLLILILTFLIQNCRHAESSHSQKTKTRTEQVQGKAKSDNNDRHQTNEAGAKKNKIPDEAYAVAAYSREHNGEAMPGYRGNIVFRNREKKLPLTNHSGKKIQYREYDIYPLVKGKRRGAKRVVIDSDGNAYYTKDHYKTFIKMEP